jgi:hypothetical protein
VNGLWWQLLAEPAGVIITFQIHSFRTDSQKYARHADGPGQSEPGGVETLATAVEKKRHKAVPDQYREIPGPRNHALIRDDPGHNEKRCPGFVMQRCTQHAMKLASLPGANPTWSDVLDRGGNYA